MPSYSIVQELCEYLNMPYFKDLVQHVEDILDISKQFISNADEPKGWYYVDIRFLSEIRNVLDTVISSLWLGSN